MPLFLTFSMNNDIVSPTYANVPAYILFHIPTKKQVFSLLLRILSFIQISFFWQARGPQTASVPLLTARSLTKAALHAMILL